MFQVVLLALARGLCIVFGGTVVAHALLSTIAEDRGTAADLEGYWSLLGRSLNPGAAVTTAIGNTMVLAAAGILLGAITGAAIGALLRRPRLGRVVGLLVIPAMALAVPGTVLYPVVRLASEFDLAPIRSVALGDSLEDGMRSLALWGSVIGLAVTPAVAAAVGGVPGLRRTGVAVAQASSAARPDPRPLWRFGFPTTAVLMAMTVAELSSGHPGIFPLFFQSLASDDPATVFALLFWVMLAGAALAALVDLAGALATAPDTDPAPESASHLVSTAHRRSPVPGESKADQGRSGTARLLPPMVVALAIAAAVAVVGAMLDSPAAVGAAAPFASPTFGGPWLGADQLGRSNLAMTSAGLGPALLAGLLPGLVATVLGSVLALIIRAAGGLPGRMLAAAVDVLWWPGPMILGLAVLAFDTGRPDLQPVIILLTGLALTPLATRVLGRIVLPAPGRFPIRLSAAWLLIAATAMSLHLVVGFAGLADADRRLNLGLLMADGIDGYDRSPWPLLVPAVASSFLLAALYGLASAVIGPDRRPLATTGGLIGETRALSVATVADRTGDPTSDVDPTVDTALPVAESLPSEEPVGEPPPVPEPFPVDEPEPVGRSGSTVAAVSIAAPVAADTLVAAEPASLDGPPTADDRQAERADGDRPRLDPVGSVTLEPLSLDQQRQSTGQAPSGQASEPVPEAAAAPRQSSETDAATDVEAAEPESAVALDAAKTVELRPSTLRRAGIAAPTLPTAPTELSSGWSKPILAARPAGADDDQHRGEPIPDDTAPP